MAGGPTPAVQIDSVLRHCRGFQLSSGLEVNEPIIVLNGEALLWRPRARIDSSGVLMMDTNTLAVFEISITKPDMVIIGTGARNEFLERSVREYLHNLGINVDTMDTRNAASTFNVLAAEGRNVAVALLPAE
ncbi:hypothetical protein PYCC9005_005379 [Savitreella phatthalungensis]